MQNGTPEVETFSTPQTAPQFSTASTLLQHESLQEESPEETHSITFTGSGKEYFRIWIVNLCLTIATLGIYSAWAKVRRLQYFYRNTQLGGATFDFHGDPKAILKGRLVAVALVVAYNYAFGFSAAVGITVICLLLLALPWMLRSALRFRLRNTSYRGLRFDFGGSLADAYGTYFPVVVILFLPTVLLTLFPTQFQWVGVAFLLYFAWPYLHARIKRYQHGNLAYGASQASYAVPSRRFFPPYMLAALFAFTGVALAGGITALFMAFSPEATHHLSVMLIPIAAMLIVTYTAYLVSGPYLQVRIQNLVWCNTSFPDAGIKSDLRVWAYIKLQTVNAILTLLTLGLYRPFAVVRVYKYRLAHTTVRTTASFDQLLAGQRKGTDGASGDSAADFFNFDLSW